MLVSKGKSHVDSPTFKGPPVVIDKGWQLEHPNGKFSIASERDPSTRSNLYDEPPTDLGEGWMGKKGMGIEIFSKRTLHVAHEFREPYEDLGPTLIFSSDGGGTYLVSRNYKGQASPLLKWNGYKPLGSNWIGELQKLPFASVLMEQAEPGNHSENFFEPKDWNKRLYDNLYLVDAYEYFDLHKERKAALERAAALDTDRDSINEGAEKLNEMMSLPANDPAFERKFFFIHKDDPSTNSNTFWGVPVVNKDSFFVQADRGSWRFFDRKRPQHFSIEIPAGSKIESRENAWVIHLAPKKLQLIQKNDITKRTGVLTTLEDLGWAWKGKTERGYYEVVHKSNFPEELRELRDGPYDYGNSKLVQEDNGHWLLIDPANPGHESIPFARIIEGPTGAIPAGQPAPEWIKVEGTYGGPIWISTKSLKDTREKPDTKARKTNG